MYRTYLTVGLMIKLIASHSQEPEATVPFNVRLNGKVIPLHKLQSAFQKNQGHQNENMDEYMDSSHFNGPSDFSSFNNPNTESLHHQEQSEIIHGHDQRAIGATILFGRGFPSLGHEDPIFGMPVKIKIKKDKLRNRDSFDANLDSFIVRHRNPPTEVRDFSFIDPVAAGLTRKNEQFEDKTPSMPSPIELQNNLQSIVPKQLANELRRFDKNAQDARARDFGNFPHNSNRPTINAPISRPTEFNPANPRSTLKEDSLVFKTPMLDKNGNLLKPPSRFQIQNMQRNRKRSRRLRPQNALKPTNVDKKMETKNMENLKSATKFFTKNSTAKIQMTDRLHPEFNPVVPFEPVSFDPNTYPMDTSHVQVTKNWQSGFAMPTVIKNQLSLNKNGTNQHVADNSTTTTTMHTEPHHVHISPESTPNSQVKSTGFEPVDSRVKGRRFEATDSKVKRTDFEHTNIQVKGSVFEPVGSEVKKVKSSVFEPADSKVKSLSFEPEPPLFIETPVLRQNAREGRSDSSNQFENFGQGFTFDHSSGNVHPLLARLESLQRHIAELKEHILSENPSLLTSQNSQNNNQSTSRQAGRLSGKY